MERTQIYLDRQQSAALDREAKRRGTTRSHLIREAIEARYGDNRDRAEALEAVRASAGLWADRTETGAEYVERLRSGRRLRELYADHHEEQSAR